MHDKYLTTQEVADFLGISRVAVFKKIKKGEIKAEKIGRNYLIKAEDFSRVFNKKLDEGSKEKLTKSVNKVMKDYGEALKLLGNE